MPTSSLRLIGNDGQASYAPYGYGMPSEIVLEDLMCLNNDVPIKIASIINDFNAAVRGNDAIEAQKQLTALLSAVPNHPELPRMRKRVEIMSR